MELKKVLTLENIKGNLLKLTIWIHLFAWVLNLPLTQLQMQLFGRRIITLNYLALAECLLIIIIIILSNKMYINKITKYTITFIMVLLTIGLIGMIINNVHFYWIIYYFVYWIIPFIIIIMSNQIKLNIDKLNWCLLTIVIIHTIIIFIQRFTNSIFWPFISDEYGNQLFYISEGYYNTADKMLRCPGLSISGLDAGLLLIFGCVLLYFMRFKNKLVKYILYILFIVAIWFTGTRNIFIMIAYMIVYVIILKITRKKLRIIFCNIYMILSSIIYTCTFFIIGRNYSDSTRNILTDTLSAKIRLDNWSNVVNLIKEGNIIQQLLGQFKWQSNMENVVIDNIFLELILFSGILGLTIFFIYIVFVQIQLIKLENERIDLLIAFVSALMIFGVANVLGNMYISLIVVCILIVNNLMYEVRKSK